MEMMKEKDKTVLQYESVWRSMSVMTVKNYYNFKLSSTFTFTQFMVDANNIPFLSW